MSSNSNPTTTALDDVDGLQTSSAHRNFENGTNLRLGETFSAEDDETSILSRLYEPDRKQKPELWAHIRLVAPGPKPSNGQTKWRSKDAVAAYCLKCKKQFTYTRGTSKTVSRHMVAFHGLVELGRASELSNGHCPDGATHSVEAKAEDAPEGEDDKTKSPANSDRKTATLSSQGKPKSSEPPFKKRKIQPSPFLATVHRLVMKWLVSSLRPFDLVTDPGLTEIIGFVSSLDYKLPSPLELTELAETETLAIKNSLRAQLEVGCDWFSLSSTIFSADSIRYCVIGITYLTPQKFERKSHTLAVRSLPQDSMQDVDEAISKTISSAISEYPQLTPGKMTGLTSENCLVPTKWGWSEEQPKEKFYQCVAYTMNGVVKEWLNGEPFYTLLPRLRCLVKMSKATGSAGGAKSLELALRENGFVLVDDELGGRPKSTYLMIQSLLQVKDSIGMLETAPWMPTAEDWIIIEALCSMLRPFYDAIITLEAEKFPSVGLTISVLRRIHACVAELDFGQEEESKLESLLHKSKHGLARLFSEGFSSVLGEQPRNMWTIPLDPRLVHMRGLSGEERSAVAERLKAEVEKEASIADIKTREDEKTVPKGTIGGQRQTSTMDSLFLGEDDDPTLHSKTDQETVSNAYAQATIDRYFHTVRSSRHIDDPLSWWSTNHMNFPELARLARKWLCLSSTRMEPGKLYSAEMAERVRTLNKEQAELIIFLHGNKIT